MKPHIILTAVGDICLGDSPKCLGFGVKSQIRSKGSEYIFNKIQGALSGDIVFGNLEVVLSEAGLIPYDFYSEQLRGAPSYVPALRRAGFTVLNIANNHIMQHGKKAFWETYQLLKQEQIHVVGRKSTGLYHSSLEKVTVADNVVGFLGYAFEKDKYSPFCDIEYACCVSQEDIIADVIHAKKEVDWLIVSTHWGLEFMHEPSPTVMLLGKHIINSGADIVLGHHPHVLQGVEEYKHGIICYSLGNFIFDMYWNSNCSHSMIAQFQLLKGQPIKYSITPINVNKQCQPQIDNNITPSNFKAKLQNMVPNCINEPAFDIEKSNVSYYKKYLQLQRKDTIASNLFFLWNLLIKTPISFLPGKVKYFFKKTIKGRNRT